MLLQLGVSETLDGARIEGNAMTTLLVVFAAIAGMMFGCRFAYFFLVDYVRG